VSLPGRLRAGWLGAALVSLSALATLGACLDAGGPHIDRVSPAAAPRGATVELSGDGFCRGDCATTTGYVDIGVELPMVRAAVTAWSATRIAVVVPEAAPVGRTDLIVTVDGSSSNAVAFEVQ